MVVMISRFPRLAQLKIEAVIDCLQRFVEINRLGYSFQGENDCQYQNSRKRGGEIFLPLFFCPFVGLDADNVMLISQNPGSCSHCEKVSIEERGILF